MMRGLTKVVVSAAVAALAITALGAPVSAADEMGTLAIVNGHPGQRIDMCIGDKEQRSGVPYGSYYRKDVISTGTKLLRFYKYDPSRTCGGTLIARKWVKIGKGSDKTVVVTKRDPKVVVFNNVSPYWLGEIPARGEPWLDNAVVSFRSAADFDSNFHFKWWEPNNEIGLTPAETPAVWDKGKQLNQQFPADHYVRVRATKPNFVATAAQRTVRLQESRRYEWILVGTRKGNAKFVLVNRRISKPSP